MSDSPYVEIVDVVPNAVKITAGELAVGDSVFDVFGGTHTVVSARLIRKGRTMSFRRDDSREREWFAADKTITILRGDRTKEVERLTREWRAALEQKDSRGTDADDAAEQTAWDELVDFVEANGLNFTRHDPRGADRG